MVKTILIAANDPNIVYLLRRYAEMSGFVVRACGVSDDIACLAREILPVLILLEIDTPEASWRPILTQLKTDSGIEAIPVMVYTCLDETIINPEDEVSGSLRKSITYQDFIEALESAGISPGA